MRIDRAFLGWGIFFILVGAVPLAVRGGSLTADQVAALWTAWPLFLVGAGLALLLRGTPLQPLGGLLVAGVSGVIVGGFLAAGIGGFSVAGCGDSGTARPFPANVGSLTSPAQVSITLDCGTLDVAAQDGTGYRVEGEDATGTGPDVRLDGNDLTIRSNGADRGPFDWLGPRETWRVGLPRDVDLDVDVEVDAGSSTIDLAGTRIGSADVELNAGSAVLDLSQTQSIGDFAVQVNAGSIGILLPSTNATGSLQVNAGSVKLCTAPGVALRIRTGDGFAASYDFDGHGLVQTGSTWESPDYATAPVRVDLETEGNAGSFTLDPAEGCDD